MAMSGQEIDDGTDWYSRRGLKGLGAPRFFVDIGMGQDRFWMQKIADVELRQRSASVHLSELETIEEH
jgi:hypothetical protein